MSGSEQSRWELSSTIRHSTINCFGIADAQTKPTTTLPATSYEEFEGKKGGRNVQLSLIMYHL
jgi:hypothetical protein